jgi:hypothetical protein
VIVFEQTLVIVAQDFDITHIMRRITQHVDQAGVMQVAGAHGNKVMRLK